MQSAELKKSLVSSGVYKQYCDVRFALYQAEKDVTDRSLYPFLSDDEFKACCQLLDAKTKQRKRITQWLDYWLKVDDVVLLFGTQTFNDKALSRSFTARQKDIQRMLTQYEDYCSNVDYGTENEREHYHFLVAVSKDLLQSVEWKTNKRGRKYASSIPKSEKYLSLGHQNWQLIDFDDDAIEEKLAGYIAKLVNHSIKVKQTKLGYKRDSTYKLFQKENENWSKLSKVHGEMSDRDYAEMYAWRDDRKLMMLFDGAVAFTEDKIQSESDYAVKGP